MNDYILYRNELKSKHPAKYKLIGIVSGIVLSKDIFKKNNELKVFIKNTFNIEFKEYVFSSRTMVVAKLVRLINDSNENEYIIYKSNLYFFLENILDNTKNKSMLDSWKF